MRRLTKKGESKIDLNRSTREAPEGERIMPSDWNDVRQLKAHINRYMFSARYATNNVCLDIACGSGFGSHYLKKGGARMVVGGDISPEGIEYANRNYAEDNVRFQILDAQRLPFENDSFDVIVSHGTIEHLPRPTQFLGECYRVLRPGGILICSAPNKAITSPYGKPPDKYHFEEFYVAEFNSFIETYFQNTTIYGEMYAKKGLKLHIYLFGLHKVLPLIHSLPKGQSLAEFLIRFIRGRKYAKLEEIEGEELPSIDDIAPYPQEGKEPAHIIIVARK
ncbi:methyltransferase domain-containing protein [Chloroflexota bacterium]